MKTCLKCGIAKPLTEFNRAAKARDGLRTRCRDCTRAQDATWRADHPDAQRLWHEANRERQVIYAARSLAKHHAKRVARKRLHYAVLVGKIVRPAACPQCGRTGRVEAHHDDYNRPLDVRWFCPKCHQAVHVRLRDAARSAA